MIKAYLEQAIKSIEAEKAQKISVAKDAIMREKIAPYNAQVDTDRAKALTAIDAELNAKIAEVKSVYEAKKQEIVALGEAKKKENAEAMLTAELAVITVAYDKHIAKLTAQLAEAEE